MISLIEFEDGYPTDESLERFELDAKQANISDLVKFMTGFTSMMKGSGMSCHCEEWDGFDDLSGKPIRIIEFSTYGWSGSEQVIGTVLSVPLIKMMFHESWKRGGHYVFEIPHSFMEQAGIVP